jgi:hypothetical protein
MVTRSQPIPARQRLSSRSGWTLVEMMVALVAGFLILATILAVTLFVRQTFVAIGSYSDLNRLSRNALDTLSKDIRNSAAVTYTATNLIILSNLDTTVIVYQWTPATATLIRSNQNGIRSLLTNCDYLCFKNYQRNPSNGFAFYPIDNSTNQTKLIDVSWHCTRSLLGTKRYTESVQTAKIVIRN